jgi:glutamine synthetase
MDITDKLNMTMLCDFYELTMGNGYLEAGLKDRITYFDIFFRDVPDHGGYAICAGLERIIAYIQDLHFSEEDIEYLRSKDLFSERFLDYLRDFKFTGDVWAIPEGTPIFPREPIITVRAPAIQAQLVETGKADNLKEGGVLRTGVSTLPDFVKDATDRNRTSPFAFTGNKFEFRMVGSEDSIGSPNTTLNAIVAEAFCEAADRLEGAEDFDMAVHDLIKEYMTEHQRIIFNGNGYAREWEEEAARRGLPNIPSMVAAVDTLTTPKAIHLFEKFGIFTEAELRSRAEVLYETYAKTINIEALTMVDMANKQIIPAVMKYSKSLADAVIAITEAGGDTYVPTRMLQQITQKLTEMEKASEALLEVEKKASAMERGKEQAFCYHDEVMVAMNALRKPADELEKLVDKKYWPFPTYADLLFEV